MTASAAGMVVALSVLAGLLIGAVGIGGVILVPALVYFVGTPIHVAIAGAMMSFIMTGVVGTLVYAKAGSIRWDRMGWLGAGAMPGAVAGTAAASMASASMLEIVIGLLTAASGLHTLLSSHASKGLRAETSMSNPVLALIGAVTGFASSMSGTGGPLVLVPVLMWLDVPVLIAVGLSQVIQLPIAVLATAGNAYYGSLDLMLGGLLAAGVALGAWAGANIAHAVPRAALRRSVSVILVVVGVLIFIKVVARVFV